jgi:large subunit ribosomal protein L13
MAPAARTFQQKTEDTQHDWYVVDATGQRLGALAVRIAQALAGRHKPTWTPHTDDGDHVVVLNAEKIELSGNKWQQKVYHRHSGYPGGLKTETAQEIRVGKPPQARGRARKARARARRDHDQQKAGGRLFFPSEPFAAHPSAFRGNADRVAFRRACED